MDRKKAIVNERQATWEVGNRPRMLERGTSTSPHTRYGILARSLGYSHPSHSPMLIRSNMSLYVMRAQANLLIMTYICFAFPPDPSLFLAFLEELEKSLLNPFHQGVTASCRFSP